MSAFLDRVHHLLDEAKAEFEHLLGHGDQAVKDAVKNAGERIDAAKAEIAKAAPVLEHEAEADVADVVHTAATEGVIPAEQEAVKDGGELAGEVAADVTTAVQGAAHDVADALAGSSKAAEPDPAQTTAQTTAVIASEAAVAAEQGA